MVNGGTLVVDEATDLTVGVAVVGDARGALKVFGTLALGGGGSAGGAVELGAKAELWIERAELTLLDTSRLAGEHGSVVDVHSGGGLVVQGASATEALKLQLVGGQVKFASDAVIGELTQTGGLLTGAGRVGHEAPPLGVRHAGWLGRDPDRVQRRGLAGVARDQAAVAAHTGERGEDGAGRSRALQRRPPGQRGDAVREHAGDERSAGDLRAGRPRDIPQRWGGRGQQDADLTIGVPLSGGAGGTLKVHGALTLAGGGTQAGPVELGAKGTLAVAHAELTLNTTSSLLGDDGSKVSVAAGGGLLVQGAYGGDGAGRRRRRPAGVRLRRRDPRARADGRGSDGRGAPIGDQALPLGGGHAVGLG